MRETRRRYARIYAWICPNTGFPVYVGKTSVSTAVRMREHKRMAKEGHWSLKYMWLRDILSRGKEPDVIELEWCSVDASARVERIWVDLLSERFTLLNTAAAGAGNPGVGHVEWTVDLIARLGKEHDQSIAADIGCNRKTVAYRRIVLGISACPLPQPLPASTIHLESATIERLGKEPDYRIARDLGVSKHVIWRHRVRLGIEDFAASTGKNGRIAKGEVHRRWGESKITDEVVALLGTMTDEELGKAFGISKAVIYAARKERGIQSHAQVRDKAGRQRRFHTRCYRKPAEVIPLLGTMPDEALAQKFGLSSATVGNERRKRGIASYSNQGRRKKL